MNENERRSTKASLKAFRENNPDPDGGTRGEALNSDVLLWIDFAGKQQAGYKTSEGSEGVNKSKKDFTDSYRWGREKILKEIGDEKGQDWIDEGVLLGPLPDQLTGKRGVNKDECRYAGVECRLMSSASSR